MIRKKMKTQIRVASRGKEDVVIDREIDVPSNLSRADQRRYVMAYLDYIAVLDGISRITFETIEDKIDLG